jgi:hypothetical protein
MKLVTKGGKKELHNEVSREVGKIVGRGVGKIVGRRVGKIVGRAESAYLDKLEFYCPSPL